MSEYHSNCSPRKLGDQELSCLEALVEEEMNKSYPNEDNVKNYLRRGFDLIRKKVDKKVYEPQNSSQVYSALENFQKVSDALDGFSKDTDVGSIFDDFLNGYKDYRHGCSGFYSEKEIKDDISSLGGRISNQINPTCTRLDLMNENIDDSIEGLTWENVFPDRSWTVGLEVGQVELMQHHEVDGFSSSYDQLGIQAGMVQWQKLTWIPQWIPVGGFYLGFDVNRVSTGIEGLGSYRNKAGFNLGWKQPLRSPDRRFSFSLTPSIGLAAASNYLNYGRGTYPLDNQLSWGVNAMVDFDLALRMNPEWLIELGPQYYFEDHFLGSEYTLQGLSLGFNLSNQPVKGGRYD